MKTKKNLQLNIFFTKQQQNLAWGFLRKGDVDKIVDINGGNLAVRLPIISGKKIGSKIGYPTINQELPREFRVLKSGCYVVVMFWNKTKIYSGLACVFWKMSGRKKGDLAPYIVETNLLDFQQVEDLTKSATLVFLNYYRNFIPVKTTNEIKTQIENDWRKQKDLVVINQRLWSKMNKLNLVFYHNELKNFYLTNIRTDK